MLWDSFEVPHRDPSNEYPQHMFLSRNKKNIDTFWLKKSLIKSYELRVNPFQTEYTSHTLYIGRLQFLNARLCDLEITREKWLN